MATATRKMRPPCKRHGGKSYLARWIVGLMPEHRVYVEPFVGGGSVLLNKPRAAIEVAGDLDDGLISLWAVLRGPGAAAFLAMLDEIPYDAASFNTSVCWLDSPDPVARAIGYLVRNRFSRGGMGKAFAWSDRLRGGRPGDANAWDTIKAELPAIAERVRDVQFNCVTALTLIPMYDGPESLIYADPPYLHETRTARKVYEHEMDREGHVMLLDTLLACRGKVMLSGYRSPLYDGALAGWRRADVEMANHSSQSRIKARRTECVWMNWGGN